MSEQDEQSSYKKTNHLSFLRLTLFTTKEWSKFTKGIVIIIVKGEHFLGLTKTLLPLLSRME